jgi:hypothetical protein
VAVLLVVELDGGAQVVEAGVQGGDLAVVGGGRKLRNRDGGEDAEDHHDDQQFHEREARVEAGAANHHC